MTDEPGLRERRRAARVDVRDVRVLSGPPLEVRNISPSGMRFRASFAMGVGDAADIELALPGVERPLALTFVVAQREGDRGERYRAVFVEPPAATVEQLKRFVFERLLVRTVDGLVRRYPSLDRGSLQTITDPGALQQLLAEVRASRRPLMATGATLGAPMRVFLKRVEEDERTLQLGSRDAHRMLLGSTRLLTTSWRGRSIYLEIAVIEGGDRFVRVLRPELVFFTDKRVEYRFPVPEGQVHALLPLPYPEGRELRLRVLDMSHGGLALEFPENRYPLPGTPIPVLHLESESEEHPSEVGPLTVRHVSAHPDDLSGLVRVGLQYSVPRRALDIGRSTTLDSIDPDPLFRTTSDDGSRLSVEPDRRAGDDGGPAPRPAEEGGEPAVESRLVEWLDDRAEQIVGRLDTTPGADPERPLPLVVIPPAAVKTKESTVGLAHTIVRAFRSLGLEVAVLRYDGIRRRGESHRDGAPRPLGEQMLAWRHSQGISDMRSALTYARSCEYVLPSHVMLVTFSGAALEARRLLADDPGADVDLWIPTLAVPEFAESSRRVYGGLDIIELEALGMLPAELRAMGEALDAVPYVRDAVEARLVGMEQAERDMAAIGCDVCWIAGIHDGWVDARQVSDLMTVEPEGGHQRVLYHVETGHNLRGSQQAVETFTMIAEILAHHVAPGAGPPRDWSTPAEIEDATAREAERLDQNIPRDMARYWRRYLLGDEGEIGFDILLEGDDYARFLRRQVELLDVGAGQVVADLGAGTGNLAAALVQGARPERLPAKLVLVDLVAEALAEARHKVATALDDAGGALDIETRVANLEFNRWTVVRDYIEGRLHGPLALIGRVPGFGAGQLERLAAAYDQDTHEVMRGALADTRRMRRLARRHEPDVLARILEFSRAARLVQNAVVPEDLAEPVDLDVRRPYDEDEDTEPGTGELLFRTLGFDGAAPGELPPIRDREFDRIASSLTLCYLNEPPRVLTAFHRYLRPGGRIVLSTPRPDMDISLIFNQLVERLQGSTAEGAEHLLDSARAFSNDAALLLSLEERGLFHLYEPDALRSLFAAAGFVDVEVDSGLGTPPQAYIVHARRPA